MRVFWLLMAFFFSLNLKGQDIHFSQYYNSPLTLNPGFTGWYEGDFRVANTYRSQWSRLDPGYITNAFSFDKQFNIGAQQFSGGLLFVYDRSGINYLKSARAGLSLAWNKQFDIHSFTIGIQENFIFKSIDRSKITLPEQFNQSTGYFDPGMPNNESVLDDKRTYGDFNAGIGYQLTLDRHTAKVGFAIFHLNKPKDTFFNTNNKLPWRKCVTLSDAFLLNDNITLTGQLLFMEQVKANEWVPGVTATRKLDIENSKFKEVSAGLYVRTSKGSGTDAIIPVLAVKYDLFDVAVSYDVNISGLHTATASRGGFEISVIYTALSSKLFKIKIPCDRY